MKFNLFCKYWFLSDLKIVNKILLKRLEIEFDKKWCNIYTDKKCLIHIFKYISKEFGYDSFYFFPNDELYACIGDRNDFLCIEEVLLGLSVEFHVEFKDINLNTVNDLVLFILKSTKDLYK